MSSPAGLATYSEDAEMAVIGSILVDPGQISLATLEVQDFYLVRHQRTWAAIRELDRQNRAIDYLTVINCLAEHNWLVDAGGPAYLTRCATAVPSALNLPAYVEIVKDKATRREMLSLASEMAQAAADPDSDLESAQSRALDRLTNVQRVTGGAEPFSGVVSRFYDKLEAWAEHPEDIFGLPTGLADLDKATGGLQKREVFVLSGEPGIGKSILAMQIAMSMAAAGAPGAIYELEMDEDKLAARAMAARTGVETRAMRSGKIGEDEWPLLTDAIDHLSRLPVYLSTATHWTTMTLGADLHRLKRQAGIEWAVVDYLFLLRDRGMDTNEKTEIISRNLHQIAKNLDIALLVVHSMNKTGMGAQLPDNSNLKGSAQVAYDADVIAYLTEHIPVNGEPKEQQVRTLTLSKFREGASRYIHLVQREGIPAFGSYLNDRGDANAQNFSSHKKRR